MKSNICEEFGKKIKKYRKLKNYSTAEFAERLGVSAGLINNIENARNDVFKLELLINITKELDLPIEELFNLSTINLRKISLNHNNNSICLYKLKNENDETINLINHHLTVIFRSFLTTILEYDCKETAIEEISKNIITYLHTMRILKNI